MTLLKKAGFVRITFKRLYSYRDEKFLWYPANKGDFSYMKGDSSHFVLEVSEKEKLNEIVDFLTKNKVKCENPNGYGYIKVYY